MTERRIDLVITDIDLTLYHPFRDGSKTVAGSSLEVEVFRRADAFIARELGIGLESAKTERGRLAGSHNGYISHGLEMVHGIAKEDYIADVWDLYPEDFINEDPGLQAQIEEISESIVFLTAGPMIWASRVLAHLNIEEFANDSNFFTGERDIRKPDPRVFTQIAEQFGVSPENVVSIGDQEHTDIMPAKSIGMNTIRVGSFDTDADNQAYDIYAALQILKGNL